MDASTRTRTFLTLCFAGAPMTCRSAGARSSHNHRGVRARTAHPDGARQHHREAAEVCVGPLASSPHPAAHASTHSRTMNLIAASIRSPG